MSNNNGGGDDNNKGYEVGYGKPPKEYQFVKGQSGNPAGRPRHPRTVVEALNKILSKRMSMPEGERSKRVTYMFALMKLIVSDTFKDEKSRKFLIKNFHHLIDLQEEFDYEDGVTKRAKNESGIDDFSKFHDCPEAKKRMKILKNRIYDYLDKNTPE